MTARKKRGAPARPAKRDTPAKYSRAASAAKAKPAKPVKPAKAVSTPAPGREVDAFMASLIHAQKPAIAALRTIILAADKRIGEGIKWNAPSFHVGEHFATMHLRTKQGVGVIMHFGTKKNAISQHGVTIPDPEGLLTWLAKDRAVVAFDDANDVARKKAPFTAIIRRWITHLVVLACVLLPPAVASAQRAARFKVEETTIAQVHAAMKAKQLTCRQLVGAYLERIKAYDKRGPAINALVTVNPNALAIADSLDARYARVGITGPLHCVPFIVKDNFETRDLQTTAGSLALAGWMPPQDATMVQRIKAAGAIVLAKSNLAEWAFTPYETVSSILPGYTKNPYALDRVTAGSSGGTAAAVAANEGEVGLGTDTGNSIRGPSAHNNLVGIRSTMGLTSRAGVVPLFNSQDIAGPMARTVADAVAVFNVVVGSDPADPVTANADAHRERDYNAFVVPGGLKNKRIGVLHQAYENPGLDSEVVNVFGRALEVMKREGATIVDPAGIDSLQALMRTTGGGCNPFKHDLEAYLAARAPNAPVHTIDEILKSGKFHPTVRGNLQGAAAFLANPDTAPGCVSYEAARARLRVAVNALMDSLKLDAMVYPTWSNPPRLIGDLNTPAGDNSQLFSPRTGYPAITVPMGYTRGTLPAGITFFGRAWSEGPLITLAYGFEQATRHRRPPASAPAIASR